MHFTKEGAMSTSITLSETAVALFRSRIEGDPSPAGSRNRDAFDELVAAGLMVPDGEGDYRFAEEDGARREELLHSEEDRIERGRFEPPDASTLSHAARDLVRRIAAGERVKVDDSTRPTYRELAAARIVYPVSGFIGGPEANYRFTYWGWHHRDEWIALPAGSP
jgi:hypothetical protein